MTCGACDDFVLGVDGDGSQKPPAQAGFGTCGSRVKLGLRRNARRLHNRPFYTVHETDPCHWTRMPGGDGEAICPGTRH